ncbi:MAG TPA: HTTM domain-containing protein [Polyangiaceae bacterium]|nr:HTTM domain-containing protein [Polyangiaceae bacterium]
MRHSENPLRVEFWLGETDPRPLALFRIGLGVLVLHDLLTTYAPDWRAILSDDGVLPRGDQVDPFAWSVFDLAGSPTVVCILLVLGILAVVGFTVGYFTRATTIVSWVFLTSLHNRNLYFTDGGDDLVRYLFFYSMFADSNAALSLDVLFGRRARGPATALGLRFLQAHLALLYFVTARLKFRSGWLRNNVIFGTLQLSGFVRPPGEVLLRFPGLCRALTYVVPVLEASFPWLAFWPWSRRRARGLAIAAALGVQLGILSTMRVGIFTGVMIWSNVLWLQPEWLDRAEAWVKRRVPWSVPGRGSRAAAAGDAPATGEGGWRVAGMAVRLTRLVLASLLAVQFAGEAWGPFIGSHVRMPEAFHRQRRWAALTMPYDLFSNINEVPHWEGPAMTSDGRTLDALSAVAPGMLGGPGWHFSRWYKFVFKVRGRANLPAELGQWVIRDYARQSGSDRLVSLRLREGWARAATPATPAGPTPWRDVYEFPELGEETRENAP